MRLTKCSFFKHPIMLKKNELTAAENLRNPYLHSVMSNGNKKN
jgi:hypothetical protein